VRFDDEQPDGAPWHENHALVLASGVAALLLLALLVYAVVRVSDASVEPPSQPYLDTPSSATSSSYTTSSTTSTSYSVPSVQTSDLGGAPAGPPPPPPPDDGGPPSTADTPTTIYNPYATPTSTGSAGHI
jgi:cytoskeletal protein RodZ